MPRLESHALPRGFSLSTHGSRQSSRRTSVIACDPAPPPSSSSQGVLRGPLPRVRRFLQDKVLSGFDPSAELFAILTVYFVQGGLGVARLALTFFLKDELKLGPAEVASLTALASLPWLIKPVYGFLTDSIPLFGYRRRSWLFAAGLLGAASWLSLATVATTVPAVALASTLGAGSVAMSDVVADSLVVERVRGQPASRSGSLQALCWGSSAIGGLMSAYLSGSLLEVYTSRQIFAGTAVLPLLTASLAGLIYEKPVKLGTMRDLGVVARDRSSALLAALRNRSVFLPAVFVFLWQSTPNPDSALFFFQTNALGFGPEFLGRVRLASAGAALAGLFSYQRWFRKWEIKRLFLACTLVSVPLAMTQLLLVTRANVVLGISDQTFALTDSAVLTALGQVAFMPTLVLAARLCPPGVEGTLFAALMSVYNASGAVSNQLGGLLTRALGISDSDFTNLWKLVLMCSLSGLLPLPLLGLIDAAPPAVDSDDEGAYDAGERDIEDQLNSVIQSSSRRED
jgi:folate/biopterin transporter